jgi:type IV pilus assembly protein PilA
MIVVAIIGVIAAVAIPSFLRFQLKSKTAEASLNIEAIRKGEVTYRAEFGDYVSAAPSPATNGGTGRLPFVDVGGGFSTIGWEPEGRVYFNYAVTVVGTGYTVDASADMDGDLTPQIWGYVHPDETGTPVAGAIGCIGVVDRASGATGLTKSVGPCFVGHGSSIF